MLLAELLRDARRTGGLTQAELAEKAGTSQPTLAAYETGRLEPRLETLTRLIEASGSELVLTVKPRTRRGAAQLADVALDVRTELESNGADAAWHRVLDFVDDFRGSSIAGRRVLVADPPALTGDSRVDAACAGLAEFLCTESGIPIPTWTSQPERFAEPWWFVTGRPGFEAMALRDSPIAFARHGVFLNEGALDRV